MPKGVYKRYLRDGRITIPASTARRHSRETHNQEQDCPLFPLLSPENENEDITSINELQATGDEDMDIESKDEYYDSRESMSESDTSECSQDATGSPPKEFGITGHIIRMDPNEMFNDSSNDSNSSDDIESIKESEKDFDEAEQFTNEELNEHFNQTNNSDRDSNFDETADDSNIQDFFIDTQVDNEGIQNRHENVNQRRPQKEPLYVGCRISDSESDLILMSYAIRFGLSDLAVEGLIELVDAHLPEPVLGTKYTFLKKFETKSAIKLHYCCSSKDCQSYLKFADDHTPVQCQCGTEYTKKMLDAGGHHFIQVPIKEQLIQLLQTPNLHEQLRQEDNNQSDVVNGRVYKKLLSQGIISKGDVTLQWNTDGVRRFKSSKGEFWPIQVCVNELPFNIRNEHTLLCGLWYGKSKPNMNTFLKPFVEELTALHEDGLEYVISADDVVHQVKVHTLISSVDSVARAPLQNIMQYNGFQGCSFCLHEGERIEKGSGYARVYRGDIKVSRTCRQHLDDAREADRTGTVVNGVKGLSILLYLPVFNIAASFIPDYMHAVLLGVVKTMVDEWTAGRNKNEAFYIGSKISTIDSLLTQFQPPSEITRAPRPLFDQSLWKASEWKSFLLYYSLVILQEVNMPRKYINHWFLLVLSTNIYLQERITDEELKTAEKAIRKFVLTTEEVYGSPQLMKFNFHLLLHIPKYVENFGPIWASSTFNYEHYNGILGKMFSGTQSVPHQICKNYLRLQILRLRYFNVYQNERVCSIHAKSLTDKFMFRKSTSVSCICDGPFLRVFGSASITKLSLIEKVEIEALLGEELSTTDVKSFDRFIYRNILYHTKNYKRMVKRHNSTVELIDKRYIMITHLISVRPMRLNKPCYVILGEQLRLTGSELCRDSLLGLSSNIFCSIMVSTNTCVAVHPNMLARKCVKVFYKDNANNYIFPLVNNLERD